MTGLPKWVYDLVIALQKHEDEHGDQTSCLAPVLAMVPADVGHDADAIRRYAAMATTDVVMQQAERQWTGLVDGLVTAKEGAP